MQKCRVQHPFEVSNLPDFPFQGPVEAKGCLHLQTTILPGSQHPKVPQKSTKCFFTYASVRGRKRRAGNTQDLQSLESFQG